MNRWLEQIDRRLGEVISAYEEPILREAMWYSTFAGGKRIRPLLLLAAYDAASHAGANQNEIALNFACAVEMIHTYSMIHDDLPAMDDDDMRRGKPSSHIRFGEAAAILAGDALLNGAYEILFLALADGSPGVDARARAALHIARAAGAHGMIAGQMRDIDAEGKQLGQDALIQMYRGKTAALISASLTAGATLAGATDETIKTLGQVGYTMGIAFQIRDDLLDIEAGVEATGKLAGSDAKNNKNTYAAIHGTDAARRHYMQMKDETFRMFESVPQRTEVLKSLISRVFDREH